MKLSVLIFILFGLSLSASTYSQTHRLTIDKNNVTIAEIFSDIEAMSEFSFLYSSREIDINRRVSVKVTNALINDILSSILDSKDFGFRITDRHIILYKADPLLAEINLARQGITTTGKVTDAEGQTLPGVNVVIKDSRQGTVTDANGAYSLTVPDENSILVFSFLGFATQEILVGSQRSINVMLSEDTREIEEVVVVGYGVQKKVNVIGSISQITSEQLDGRPTPLLSNALAGQMPGVTVVQRSGRPGMSSGELRIRGVGSFGASPEALILIDGIPGGINDVSPEEVASISVLKDASSAAIYGARAANGVVLITTKTARESRVKVVYNGSAGIVKATALPEFLPSWEYAIAFNEASGTETYKEDAIQKYKDGSDPVNYPNTNFLDGIMNHQAFQTGHDITVSSGTDKNSYYVSFGYLSQDGIVKKNNYSRYNARINTTNTLAPWLKLTTRIAGLTSVIDEPATPTGEEVISFFNASIRYPAIYAGRLPNGDYGHGPENNGTSIAWIDSPSFYEEPFWKITSNAQLEITPLDGLSISAIGGYNFSMLEKKRYRSTMRLSNTNTIGPSSLTQSEERNVYSTFQSFINYTKDFSGHNIDLLAGYSFEKEGLRNLSGFRDKFPGNDLPYMSAGSPDNQQASGDGWDWAIQSLFGRIKYDYKGRYLLEGTIRHDGSSRFPPTLKYGTFPSVAAGWRVTEESFMQATSSWLTFLKLKTSWGMLGNQNIGNYPWQSVFALGTNYTTGGTFNQGSAVTTYVDPTLHWEKTKTVDGGIEMTLWKGLLSFNATYFHRKTTDVLYSPSASVSTILGMSLSQMNTGAVKNTGWEFELSHSKKFGEFSYHINGNFSIINNEVLDLGVGNVTQLNGLVGNGTDLFIGHPMQVYYGYQTDGVFLDQNDIDAWYEKNNQQSITPKNNARPGDLRYVDLSGRPNGADGELGLDGIVDANYDRKVLGSMIPKYTYAFNIGFNYKGFDFNTFFQGVNQVSGLVSNWAGYAFFNLGNIQRWHWDGRFDPANPRRYPEYPRLQILPNMQQSNIFLSDFWVRNASYLRVKNIQLGYTLPKNITQTLRLESIRIYMSAENPVTWSKYPKGWDPEINTTGVYYPVLATYILGINLKF